MLTKEVNSKYMRLLVCLEGAESQVQIANESVLWPEYL